MLNICWRYGRDILKIWLLAIKDMMDMWPNHPQDITELCLPKVGQKFSSHRHFVTKCPLSWDKIFPPKVGQNFLGRICLQPTSLSPINCIVMPTSFKTRTWSSEWKDVCASGCSQSCQVFPRLPSLPASLSSWSLTRCPPPSSSCQVVLFNPPLLPFLVFSTLPGIEGPSGLNGSVTW